MTRPEVDRTSDDLTTELSVALEVSSLAVAMIQDAARPRIAMVKSMNDYATQTDQEVESAVTTRLREISGHPVQGEELTTEEAAGTRWVIDPIDGTFNFFNGVPLVAFSVALVVEREPVVGVVTSVLSGEQFIASRGGGARLDGRRLHTSARPLAESAVMVGDFTTKRAPVWSNTVRSAAIGALGGSAGRVRMIGTAATDLAWVAAGRAAASVTFSNKPWDVCAGVLLVRESGGEVFDLQGRRWDLGCDSVVAGASVEVARRVCELAAGTSL